VRLVGQYTFEIGVDLLGRQYQTPASSHVAMCMMVEVVFRVIVSNSMGAAADLAGDWKLPVTFEIAFPTEGLSAQPACSPVCRVGEFVVRNCHLHRIIVRA
jgi:hypothetical protein